MTRLWTAIEVLSVPAIGAVIAAVLVIGFVGVCALLLPWSRNRDLERRGWKHVSRI